MGRISRWFPPFTGVLFVVARRRDHDPDRPRAGRDQEDRPGDRQPLQGPQHEGVVGAILIVLRLVLDPVFRRLAAQAAAGTPRDRTGSSPRSPSAAAVVFAAGRGGSRVDPPGARRIWRTTSTDRSAGDQRDRLRHVLFLPGRPRDIGARHRHLGGPPRRPPEVARLDQRRARRALLHARVLRLFSSSGRSGSWS